MTHPRIYSPLTPIPMALDQVDAWLQSPMLELLGESRGYWDVLRTLVKRGQTAGPRVHDARIAAVCRNHAVREQWTADRDFSRFPDLAVRNPLAK